MNRLIRTSLGFVGALSINSVILAEPNGSRPSYESFGLPANTQMHSGRDGRIFKCTLPPNFSGPDLEAKCAEFIRLAEKYRSAVPIGRDSWIKRSDFPPRDLRARARGKTTVRMDIDKGGGVTGCRVAESSGVAELDQIACELLSKGARFLPARDMNGEITESLYQSSVTWGVQ